MEEGPAKEYFEMSGGISGDENYGFSVVFRGGADVERITEMMVGLFGGRKPKERGGT
jgi:hypothetical protein